MRILFLLISLLFACAVQSVAQSVPTFTRFYNSPITNNQAVYAYDVVQTRDLGYAFTGVTIRSDSMQVFGHLTLYKANKDGALLWSKEIVLPSGTASICRDANGYAIVEMEDSSLVIAATCGYGLWLVRTSSSGNVLQLSNHSSQVVGNEISVNMCKTADGGVAVCGTDGNDGRILKFNAAGQLSWAKTYVHAGGLRTIYLKQATDGGFFLACNNGPNYDSAHIIRTDAGGNELWSRTWNATNGEFFVTSITPSSNGGCFFTGGSVLNGGFVCKLSATGAQIWWLPTPNYISYGVYEDTGKALYSFSWSSNYLLGLQEIAVNGGSVLWSRTFGQTSPQYAGDFERTADGGFILCGYGRYDNGTTLATRALLMKTDTAGNMAANPTHISNASANAASLSLYPNPTAHTISLDQSSPQGGVITISDLTGREVIALPVAAQKHIEVNVSGLAPGSYLLKLSGPGQLPFSYGRFIKH